MNKNAWKKDSIEMVATQDQREKTTYNVFGGRALRIAIGITMLVLLLAGGVGAGNSYEFVWRIPTSQQWFFDAPYGVAVDSSGNVYVADSSQIQKFSSSGVFITKWGSYGSQNGSFMNPEGIAVDSSGNVYVADTYNYRIQKFSSSGVFITKWGSNGIGDGQFGSPYGVAVDSSGNVYVADSGNNRIQKFSSSGVFITKWGSNGIGDGQFSWPYGVAVDSSGNVYVLDTGNRRIQKFSSSGVFISKWGSSGIGDGQFQNPQGIAVDSSGSVYVSDIWNYTIQKFSSSGAFISKWGGSYGFGDYQFTSPKGIAVDSGGNVYVAEYYDGIKKFSSSGVFIYKWGSNGIGDGQFNYPDGVTVDSSGNFYIVDSSNNRIQKFSSSGVFISKWGSSGVGDGQFYYPHGVTVDSSGNVYVADTNHNRIQKFSSSGVFISNLISSGSGDYQFSQPFGVAVDNNGNVYVPDAGYNRIKKFSSSGIFISQWGSSGSGDGQFSYPYGVAVDSSGNVYVADKNNNRIQKFSSSGVFISKWGSPGGSDGQFYSPQGVTVDSSGNVYVVDANSHIQKFSSSGVFIYKWGSYGSGDGQFKNPCGVVVDSSGNVYVTDTNNNRIQKFKVSAFLNSINVTPNPTNLIVGETQIFIDSPKDQYNADFPATVTWSSSNTTVGTVDETGNFTAKVVGTTMVNASNGSVNGTAYVTVDRVPPYITSINVSPDPKTLTVGETQIFTDSPKDQYDADFPATVTWTSSNITVGTVDETGNFTAKVMGTTMVNASNGSVNGTAYVTVDRVPPYIASINVSPDPKILVVGETQIFTYSPKDQYDADFPATVTWSSSNITVGTVNPSTGNFTALVVGTTLVNATNGSVNGTAVVTVKTAILTPSIAVVTPNGLENWTRGTTQTIKWKSTGSPGKHVKIELLKGAVNSTIITSTDNDGSFSWNIPSTQIPGADYKIRITSTTNSAYTDTSDNTFTIPTPTITVVTPNGLENWIRGTTQTLKWKSTGSPGEHVKIELLKGAVNSTIITSTDNDGSFSWNIPSTQIPGADYKIRVTINTDLAYTDTSNNNFIIRSRAG